MEMDSAFIENMINHAALLIQEKGKDAFATLRDKTGPFVFMDTYVFVDSPDGIEWVNPAQPSLEGTNILQLKDVKGKFVAKEYIQAALSSDNAWMNYYWYRPGENVPSLKYSFVKKVKFKNCSLQEVDFIESDLSNSIFDNCDLALAIFKNTLLEKADFRTAYNYSIDPEINRIKKAKFSRAGLVGLLDSYDIEIE